MRRFKKRVCNSIDLLFSTYTSGFAGLGQGQSILGFYEATSLFNPVAGQYVHRAISVQKAAGTSGFLQVRVIIQMQDGAPQVSLDLRINKIEFRKFA